MDRRTSPGSGQAGRPDDGFVLGVMMMDTDFPRLRGDVGNATTWPFPVTYQVVRGAHPERVAQAQPDPELLGPFLEATCALAADGVRAIITSCGFLAVHQMELATAVSIPVFTSSLLQVPTAAAILRPGQRVGILTAQGLLTERHFRGAGWSAKQVPVVQAAPPSDGVFLTVFSGRTTEMEPAAVDDEVATLTRQLMHDHPETGAIVLECTNFVPFAQTVRRISRVPVFDLFTLGMQAFLATQR